MTGLHFRFRTLWNPFVLPVIGFALTIFCGSILLTLPWARHAQDLQWVDALFTATSATCVTGLAVVDTGHFFTPFGQLVILILIQLGGLGIMTYTSLIFYLWRRRINLTDRIAVGQSLMHDPSFNLAKFLRLVVLSTLSIEAVGAGCLMLSTSRGNHRFDLFSAVFHSVSAYCNAGFSLFSNSLMDWSDDWAVNIIFMALIVAGGLGFSVLVELAGQRHALLSTSGQWTEKEGWGISWQSQVVLKTTFFLIIGGWLLIFLSEFFAANQHLPFAHCLLSSLFQSVTARTAGFNSVDIGEMTNVSLLILIILMFIGGSPGSCAGGIKTTTFRSLIAMGLAQLKGREQVVISGFALDKKTVNKAVSLTVISVAFVFVAVILLSVTEGGDTPHHLVRGQFLEILFEVVSAYGTVGLSTGLTPHLSVLGKMVLIVLMFVGRLGPIVFLSLIQSLQVREHFSWPENSLLVG